MEIGKRLIEAKEQLPHGEWGKWLEEKVEFTQRTANNFMKVYNEFSNSQSLSNLGQTKLFKLLDLPVDDREEFMSTSHEVNGETKTVDEMTSSVNIFTVVKGFRYLLKSEHVKFLY